MHILNGSHKIPAMNQTEQTTLLGQETQDQNNVQ